MARSKRLDRDNGGLVDDEFDYPAKRATSVSGRPLPDWVYEQAAARKAAGFEMHGLITIIPSEYADNPEVWAAQNGLV